MNKDLGNEEQKFKDEIHLLMIRQPFFVLFSFSSVVLFFLFAEFFSLISSFFFLFFFPFESNEKISN